ncbi:MAG: MMPL family transporter, partial [Elusimicrobiota bacterium]
MGKDKILEKIDRWSVGYARWVVRWKWAVLAAVLLTGLGLASGAARLTYNDDYRYFFDTDNPQLVAFETVQATFMKNDNAVFVVEPEGGEVFTPKTLAAVHVLTEDAWQLPFASRVDSLTNFQNSYAEGETLVVEDLIESPLSLTQEELERKKAVALNEPLVVHRLLSSSAHVAGVIVTLNMPEDDPRGNLKVAVAARELAAKIEAAHPSVDVHIAGNMPMDAAFYELTMRDMKTIVPLMYLGIVILVFVLLRSAAATFSTVMVIGLSSATGLGIAGWLGIPLSGASAAAPTMILTLAVADSIHILVTLFAEMRKGASKEESIVESLRLNMNPVFLTSLTTAIGFLSINASPVKPLRDLGNITAMGVGAAFIYSILLLPALMAVLPVRARKADSRGSLWSARLGDFVIRQRRRLLWGTASLVLAATAFLPNNELTDVWLEYFGESTLIRQDADFINKHLTGGELIEFSLGSGETGSRGLLWSAQLGDFVIRYRRRLLWGTAILVLAATAFLPKNELTDVWVEYFGES